MYIHVAGTAINQLSCTYTQTVLVLRFTKLDKYTLGCCSRIPVWLHTRCPITLSQSAVTTFMSCWSGKVYGTPQIWTALLLLSTRLVTFFVFCLSVNPLVRLLEALVRMSFKTWDKSKLWIAAERRMAKGKYEWYF